MVLKQINSYSCCLIVVSNPQTLHQGPPTGPTGALIAPKWLLVGLVAQKDWIDVITVSILIVFKKCGSSKLDNFSFYQNRVIKNPILFYQYLSLQKSHRNGYVLKIYVWISVFRRKKLFDNPVLGCWRRQLIDLL